MSRSIMLSATGGKTFIQPWSYGRIGDRVKLRDGEWVKPEGEFIALRDDGRWEEISFPDGWIRHFGIREESVGPKLVFLEPLT